MQKSISLTLPLFWNGRGFGLFLSVDVDDDDDDDDWVGTVVDAAIVVVDDDDEEEDVPSPSSTWKSIPPGGVLEYNLVSVVNVRYEFDLLGMVLWMEWNVNAAVYVICIVVESIVNTIVNNNDADDGVDGVDEWKKDAIFSWRFMRLCFYTLYMSKVYNVPVVIWWWDDGMG